MRRLMVLVSLLIATLLLGVSNKVPHTPTGKIPFFMAIRIPSPVAGDERRFALPVAITLIRFGCTTSGTAPVALIVKVQECDVNGVTCANSDAQVQVDATNTRVNDSTITDAAFDADDQLKFVVVSATTFPSEVSCDVYGTL